MVRAMFYSSKWSRKIVDYEYGPQTPYSSPKSEIFPHKKENFFMGNPVQKKKMCLLLDGTI